MNVTYLDKPSEQFDNLTDEQVQEQLATAMKDREFASATIRRQLNPGMAKTPGKFDAPYWRKEGDR
jgi:hypothetical protein